MGDELKACFHCGGNNLTDLHDTDGVHTMNCKDCGYSLPYDEWNIRPLEDALNEQIRLLKEQVKDWRDCADWLYSCPENNREEVDKYYADLLKKYPGNK